VANREIVTVSIDPFSATQPALSFTMPLFVLIFVLVILGVLIGGVAAWLRQSKWRRNSRRLEGEIEALRREMALLSDRLERPSALPPPRGDATYPPPAA
jgi:hypothetical protein